MNSPEQGESVRSRAWSPILEGSLRERALQAVMEIAVDLRTALEAKPPLRPRAAMDTATPPGLADGRAGAALFFAYMAQSFPGQGWEDLASDLLDRAMRAVGETWVSADLFSGFSGVGWTATHLGGRVFEEAVDDPCDEIDEMVQALLTVSPWPQHYDLLFGSAGLGVYALERRPRPAARQILELLVARLAEAALDRAPGLAFWSDPKFIGQGAARRHPKGYVNLGVAHGMGGIIGVLGGVCAAGVAETEVKRLLDGAVRFLIAQSLPDGSMARFPNWVAEDETPRDSRLAWCYGDPGVAAALLLAGVCADEPSWVEVAKGVALVTTRRPPETARVLDAGVCHGAGGLGHIYNRLFHATDEEAFVDAARHWLQQALGMRKPGEGAAGFLFQGESRDDRIEWIGDRSFLTGTAGLGLALLAASTRVEPAWDRILLLSAASSPK